MLDISVVTSAAERILKEHTNGYTITRNEERNEDPNVAATGKGWVGIYRGRTDYTKQVLGSSLPWQAVVDFSVEVQVANMSSGDALEADLIKREQEILGVLNDHPTLDGTVRMILGYSVEYDVNRGVSAYHQSAIITVRADARV